MRTSVLFMPVLLMIFVMVFYGCDKVTVEIFQPVIVTSKSVKPDYPVPLGCIRGYFDDTYRTFNQHIEKVAPVDSFSNCYFYGSCGNTNRQINLIRCDTAFVLAMYIMGISPDSVPAAIPGPSEYGKYAELSFYRFPDWNSTSNGHYLMIDKYGQNVIITDNTDDVLTGTFSGALRSPDGKMVYVKDGEFKLKIFRKYMKCGLTSR